MIQTVLKIGGSCLSTGMSIKQLENVRKKWDNCAMVFSAFSGVTDNLYSNYDQSEKLPYVEELMESYSILLQTLGIGDVNNLKNKILQINDFPSLNAFRAYVSHTSMAEYVSIGERLSASAGYLFLKKFTDAVYLPSHLLGITMEKEKGEWLIDVEKSRESVEKSIENIPENNVIITTGFFGADRFGQIQTLARNTSDYSAASLSAILRSNLVLFKDVNGVYRRDPKKYSQVSPIEHLNYGDAMQIIREGADIIHPKAIEVAERYGVDIDIRNYISLDRGTIITDISEEISRTH